MSITFDFLSGLYNKHSCYADRLTPTQLEAIHIPTALEKTVRKLLEAKKDVVLLGNPGDGKTHLLRLLQSTIAKVKAEVILDGTAEKDYASILQKWKLASQKKRPFCLAINQGPLNQLLSIQSPPFKPLEEVREQLRTMIYYDGTPPSPKNVHVIDLNLRTVLTKEIISLAIKNVLQNSTLNGCADGFSDETSDAYLNRLALSNPQVQDRITNLLLIASYVSRHISMRDLQGFISYILLGGRTLAETLRDPSNRSFRYFNLCFEGEGDLFDSIREVFQPERSTTPEIDEHLWENTGVRSGWIFERPPLTPDHMEDAWEQFTTLKRQYYFEHEDGGKLLSLNHNDDAKYFELVSSGSAAPDRYLTHILQAINTFFCPAKHEEGQSLRLWGAQQYDGHSPRVLVSCYHIPKEKFALQVPKLAPGLKDVLEYHPDHLLLRYRGKSPRPISLQIDRGLWRALSLARKGLPIALRSPQYSQAIQAFITKLRRVESSPQSIESVYIYNVATTRVSRVTVDRSQEVYTR